MHHRTITASAWQPAAPAVRLRSADVVSTPERRPLLSRHRLASRYDGLAYGRELGLLIVMLVALAAVPKPAQADEASVPMPGGEMSGAIGDGGLAIGDASGSLTDIAQTRTMLNNFVVAPVPGRSPQFGWSLALGAAYFLEEDDAGNDKPSVLGGFGWYAENDSYAYGVGGNMHLLDDRVRVKFGAAFMDIRYRFYGIGNDNELGVSVDVLQEAPIYFATATYRVWRQWYMGLGYLGGKVDSRVELSVDDPGNFFDPVLSLDIGAAIIPVTFDSRDHEQFPQEGWLVQGRAALFRKGVGSDFDAETFTLSANKYLPVGNGNVLAFRGYFRTTNGDAPFFLLSTFGGKSDLRGYPSGRYRDRMMYAFQGEYRWQLSDRLILTGFAGFGEVAPELDEFGRNLLPAAGIGTRFVLSKKHKVSLSFDIAEGKDGTEYYFGVGEAF